MYKRKTCICEHNKRAHSYFRGCHKCDCQTFEKKQSLRVRDIDVDIFKCSINTFITLKHKPTKTTIARCIPSCWDIGKYLKKLSKEFKQCVEIKTMYGK